MLQPFRSHRAYTWATVVTLGICMGACLMIVGVVNQTILAKPPFQAQSGLVWLRSSMLSQRINPDLARSILREKNLFSDFAAYSLSMPIAIETGENRYTWANGSLLIGDLFQVLGVRPVAGRGYEQDDFLEGSEPSMLITYKFWQEEFAADPETLGKLHNIGGHHVRLLGVLPPEFEGPSTTENFDVYIPAVHYLKFVTHWFEDNINNHTVTGVGHLPEGLQENIFNEQLEAFFSSYVKAVPDKHDIHPRVFDLMSDTLYQQKELVKLYSLIGGVFLALFSIALCNAFTYISLKSTWRIREILIRQAIGASPAQLYRQFCTEALGLVGISTIIGLVSSWLWFEGTKRFLGQLIPIKEAHLFSPTLLAVAVTIGIFLVLVLALVPIIWMRRLHLGDISRSGRGASQKNPFLGILAGLQVAISVILVIFSLLFVRAARDVSSLDPGYDTEGLVTFSYFTRHLNQTDEEYAPFRRQLEADLNALPEISRAATGQLNCLGPEGTLNILYEDQLTEDSKNNELKLVRRYYVGSGFINVVGIPLLKGRDIDYADRLDTDPVILVNQALLDSYFQDEDPLTVRFRTHKRTNPLMNVVGVIPDFMITPEIREYPVLLFASDQSPYPGGQITARVNGSVAQAKRAVEKMLDEKYAFLGVDRVQTYSELMRNNTARLRSGAILVSSAGLMAMALAIGGLLVVFSYSAVLYQRDFSIRMALGASPRQIVGLAFRKFGTICLVGILAGLACAYYLTPMSRESLSTTSPHDPAMYGLSIFLIVVTVTSVSLIISLRFLRLEPARELQE